MMFSSTIIAIKLLPTTVLHHKHSGDMMIGLLLMQDFLAIIVLTILLTADASGLNWIALGKALIALPILAGFAYGMTRFFLLPILAKFDRIQEFMFLIAIGWCLGIAEMAAFLGLSLEIGAFIAGIALATSPIAQHIALSLKPLRDFFLIVFFFAIGAGFNVGLLPTIWLPALLLAALMLGAKPVIYRFLMARQSESRKLAWDLGFRLGQLSEFSLLIVFLAVESQLMGERASVLVQAATIVSLIVSSYVVIFNFPNPLAVSDRLRRD